MIINHKHNTNANIDMDIKQSFKQQAPRDLRALARDAVRQSERDKLGQH